MLINANYNFIHKIEIDHKRSHRINNINNIEIQN